jgi:hypothetical protein
MNDSFELFVDALAQDLDAVPLFTDPPLQPHSLVIAPNEVATYQLRGKHAAFMPSVFDVPTTVVAPPAPPIEANVETVVIQMLAQQVTWSSTPAPLPGSIIEAFPSVELVVQTRLTIVGGK